MPELLIREMILSDFDNGFFEALDALSPSNLSLDEARRVFEIRRYDGTLTFVAVSDMRIVGTATLLLENKFIHGGGVVGHIEDVAVRADQQHNGIGAAMVNHLLDVCRAEGCYKVILDCEDHNIPFYEKLGFRQWERAMRLDIE